MKKILIILLSLFILCGCSNKDNIKEDDSTSDEIIDDNTQETIEISFDIWDIDPVYEFDNIDVDFTNTDTSNNYLGSPFNYDLGNLYGYVDNAGGAEVIKDGYFGFMNEKGEITTSLTYYGIGKSSSDYAHIQVGEEGCGNLARDYTVENIIDGMTLLPIGGTGYPWFTWHDEGYVEMCSWENDSASTCTISKLSASELYHLRKQGPFVSSEIKTSDFFTLTSYTDFNSHPVENIIIVKEDEFIPLNIGGDYEVEGISEGIIMLSKINTEVDYYLRKYTWWGIADKFVSYPQVRDEAFYDVMYLDSDGNRIGETYETGYPFYEGYAAVKKDGKWGYIDKQGNVVVDFIFDKATSLSNGKAWVIYNGKTGRLNIMDMINNNVPFTDEYLNVDTWKSDGKRRLEVTADALKKRQSPSTSSDRVGRVAKGSILVYTDTTIVDGYTWYKLEDGSYIADQNGEWIKLLG